MKNDILYAALSAAFIFPYTPLSQEQNWNANGQATSWAAYNNNIPDQFQLGIRYIPTLSWNRAITRQRNLYAELSLNNYGYMNFSSPCKETIHGQIKLYRLWLRFSTPQFEIRGGVQKINFGSATLLRPLMWFDRIDARDPLQLTDGVYGLLLRYYTLNNINFWFWSLYGNKKLKGWEFLPTVSDRLEYGGRAQLPVPKGEIGLSVHFRQIDLRKNSLKQDATSEERIAVDGKWDLGVGCWLEGVLVHHTINGLEMTYQTMVTIGTDYTFAVGNGWHLLMEHLFLATGDQILTPDENDSFSALSLNYPIGILDNMTAMFYYDWKNQKPYRFFSWRRSYDQWQFFLLGYWNPIQFRLYQNSSDAMAFSGRGLQVMIVFNH